MNTVLMHCSLTKISIFITLEREDENVHIRYIGEGKKNVQIIGLISHTYLVLQYIVQIIISDSCIKFQNSRSSSYWDFF